MKNILKYSVATCIASCVAIVPVIAFADGNANILTIERVFSDPPISGPSAIMGKLSPDGKILTFLKPKQDNATIQDLWAINTDGGDAYLLMDAAKLSDANKDLSPEEIARRERMRISARGVVSYYWDENGKFILVPLDGDIFSIDVNSREIKQLTKTPSDEIDARLSDNGKLLGFVRDGQLFVKNIDDGKETEISPKANGNISYGTAEFISQEEFKRFRGYWISPNSNLIIYQKTDETRVETVERTIINAKGASVVKQKYPYAGSANAITELYVKSINGGDAIKLDLGADDDFYIVNVDWAKDSKSVFVQKLSRNQKLLELIKFDPTNGKGKVLIAEKSDSWVDVNNDFKTLGNGEFIWSSERDGNKHFYLYNQEGKLLRQITKGDFAAKEIKALDEKQDLLYFEAGISTPIENNLYVTNIHAKKDKSAPIKQITKPGGWWGISMSKAGAVFIGNYSDPQIPPNVALYDSKGEKLRDIIANKLDNSHPYFAYKDTYTPPEFGSIKSSDGQDLYYSMLKPRGFDPSKKYPVIVSIYGGPASARVKKTWVDPQNRLFQERGFIVFTLDNRGTPDRSVKFTRAIYRKFGGPDIEDQVMGAKFLQSLPYVDGNNIGITGWSQGGFVTLMALSLKDTPFKAGASGAPPTEWGLYDTAYTERYMDTPKANKDGYAASDVLNRIQNIKPNSLLIAHGMADDNVLLENTTRVAAELQKRGVPFEMMLYPGEQHGLKGYQKRKFQWNLVADFFERKLKN